MPYKAETGLQYVHLKWLGGRIHGCSLLIFTRTILTMEQNLRERQKRVTGSKTP